MARLGVSSGSASLAPALPNPYPVFEQNGLRLRRGQISLWIAAPGVGKSQLLNNICVRGKLPAMYWSADTDQSTVTMRVLATLSAFTIAEVEERMEDESWAGWLRELFREARHVEWVFDSVITQKHVEERLLAYTEIYGQYPHLLVVDNLSNTVQNSADEYAELREVVTGLQATARKTGTHIAMLGHAKGEYENATKPIPQGGALGNLAKLPDVVVTMFRPSDTQLGVSVVKNRAGKADPSGKTFVTMNVDYSRAAVLGFKPR